MNSNQEITGNVSASSQHASAQHDLKSLELSAASLEAKISTIVDQLKGLPIIATALERLEHELPPLAYHTVQHTQEVLRGAVSFAIQDGISSEDVELIAIAAAYHDLGFIVRRNGNEPIGAAYAREAMSAAGYSESAIKDVEQAILDTQLKPSPESKTLKQVSTGRISPYLLDADLANFGRTYFWKKSLLVFEELIGPKVTGIEDLRNDVAKEYILGTIKLVRHHEYHSDAAKKELTPQKIENEAKLLKLFVALTGGVPELQQEGWNELVK